MIRNLKPENTNSPIKWANYVDDLEKGSFSSECTLSNEKQELKLQIRQLTDQNTLLKQTLKTNELEI